MQNEKLKQRTDIRRIIKTMAVLAMVLAILYASYDLFFDPYRGTVSTITPSKDLTVNLSAVEARADLAFVVDKLKTRHPAFLNGMPPQVQSQYDLELGQLTPEVSVLELWQAVARILARLGDAHTAVGFRPAEYQRLPLVLRMLDGLLFWQDALGGITRVIEINGLSVDLLYQRFLDQFSFELESWASHGFVEKIRDAHYLEFVGVEVSNQVSLTLSDGLREWQETVAFGDPEGVPSAAELPSVFYALDPKQSLGILTLTTCRNNEFYRETVRDFFRAVKEHSLDIIAVDLRTNGGGNSSVINEFLRYIEVEAYSTSGSGAVRIGPFRFNYKKQINRNSVDPDLSFGGELYVLTSANTFSSAQMFAVTIADNNIGQIIGETPGNMPASYGDILTFQTPHANLLFTVSYKYFGRIDETKEDQPLLPDYPSKADEAMERLYEITSSDAI